MQVPEQEDRRGSREGKGRTRVVDDKTKIKYAVSTNKSSYKNDHEGVTLSAAVLSAIASRTPTPEEPMDDLDKTLAGLSDEDRKSVPF